MAAANNGHLQKKRLGNLLKKQAYRSWCQKRAWENKPLQLRALKVYDSFVV